MRYDRSIALVFVFLALCTRFYRVTVPDEVVFDEVHFGKFASYYLRRTFYFDVHPPLGRLLLALVGYLVGYDGHYDFAKIGESYIENNVPYEYFRYWTAFCGAILVYFTYRMMRKMGFTIGAVLTATAIVFDNALITQSKFILLDSMLMMFVMFTLYAWTSFYTTRHQPFSLKWYYWLILTGIGLGCTLSVKMVGLFTVATIGLATIVDLWDLLDLKRKLSIDTWLMHLLARIFGLIVVPVTLYLLAFQVHFMVLTHSGPGDGFLSHQFQSTLINSPMNSLSHTVYYGASIRLRYPSLKAYLHSHTHRYPLRYEDNRVSSNGQQVTGYKVADHHNIWQILPLTPIDMDAPQPVSSGDTIQLYHNATNCYLKTHDVASPLTKTNTEITCTINQTDPDTHFEVEGKGVLKTLGNTFQLKHLKTKVWLHMSKEKLPSWGYEQYEMNGIKKEGNHNWMVESCTNLNFSKPLATPEPIPQPHFFSKFLELQSRMISSNSKLTKPHPYSSRPDQWFLLHRGLSFWQSKPKQIYLIGNPLTWWIASGCVIVYVLLTIVVLITRQRQVQWLTSCFLNSCRYRP